MALQSAYLAIQFHAEGGKLVTVRLDQREEVYVVLQVEACTLKTFDDDYLSCLERPHEARSTFGGSLVYSKMWR